MSLKLSSKKVKKSWRDLISPTKPLIPGIDDEKIELITKAAIEKYPIGTKYISVSNTSFGEVQEVKSELKYTSSGSSSLWYNFITDGHGGCVFYKGKWAKIVKHVKKEKN